MTVSYKSMNIYAFFKMQSCSIQVLTYTLESISYLIEYMRFMGFP